MSTSGLEWQPVIEAWIKTRNELEQEVFQRMFDESFQIMYSWSMQNLQLAIKVLQCNIVQQVRSILYFNC